ncbi:MAG TPA: class I SAM-dependent methyltransferase [Anaerolineae bacterium]|nr:class I SAM-dependent methyltransferase [Anaerolineae bacterium]
MVEKEYYEDAWKRWDDMKSFGPASRHVRRLIFQMIKNLSFSSVLDAGCGAGTLLIEMRKRYPQIELRGVEYAFTGVSAAREKNPDAKIRQLDLVKQHLPASFDLVTCIDVLEHIQDDVSTLRNLRKMTRKYFLLVVPTGPLFKQEKIKVGHVHGFSRKEVLLKLRDAGFKVEKKIAWGFPFYNIYRRIVMNMPKDAVGGKFSQRKKMLSNILYWLLFLNLPIGGERFFVLSSVEEPLLRKGV